MFHKMVIGAAGNQRLVRTVRIRRDMITALGTWRLPKLRASKLC